MSNLEPTTAPDSWSLKPWIARLGTEAGRQTTLLYGAQMASTGLNFVLVTVLAKVLGHRGYGVYALCYSSIIVLFGSLFDFGLFPSGARLLATADGRVRERRLLGALLLASLVVGTLLAVGVVLVAPLVDRYRPGETPVAWMLAAAAPFALAVPLLLMLEFACQGTNRIGALALLRVAQPLVGLSLVGLLFATAKLSAWTAVVASLAAGLAAAGIVTALLRPAFGGVLAEAGEIARETRAYGFQMYLGRCVGLASSRLDVLLIPFLIGDVAFGIYSVAQRVSEPVVTLARSIAMTRFKAFAGRTHVSAYIVRWNAALMAVAVAGLATVGRLAVDLILGPRWQPVKDLLLPFALAALFAGLMQPYNVFLGAHGRGRELRNISLLLGLVNIAGLFAVVRPYGLLGAATWAVAAMAFSFVLNLYYYRRVRKELENIGNE